MEEVPTRIEPCLFEEGIPPVLARLVDEIRASSARLRHGLPAGLVAELADVLRIANSFHSNLIEGHRATPASIELALMDGEASALAAEGAAHVAVQREVDDLFSRNELPVPTSRDFVLQLHRGLYDRMPSEFAHVAGPSGEEIAIRSGMFRADGDPDVVVGRHHPPSSSRVSAFMDHFSRRYRAADAGSVNGVIAIAAAHHRFNYIHPFPDGNGRVSRLMSHAMALRAGIGGNGLWSVSRGLYFGLKERDEYKRLMDHADHPRMGDIDGRGNLSLRALTTFCEWFLSTIFEQIRFSEALFAPNALDARYRKLVASLVAEHSAPDVVSSLLAGKQTVSHPQLVEELVSRGFVSPGSAGLCIRFPLEHHGALFPGLFAETSTENRLIFRRGRRNADAG
ncbi:Fic family protein [Pararhizobium sp. BT-229]|uniref:Fic family protein n=1 Tax=Pararhizobium sp. BT-229 TaxID=2986923 RepID=UPI0021F734DB|nr:Fic family protein [Pararhizobium sp. BT-229]MCV9964786.1 Fic family protein [Pararhizobium sp. BT-229]